MNSIYKNCSTENLFFEILKTKPIKTLFQPILNLKTNEVLGYEALSRGPKDTPLESPLALIEIAKRLNKTWELEQLLRSKALEKSTFTNEKLLFLNIDPNIIKDDNFKKGFTKKYLHKLGILPKSIVFELTERSAISNYEDFKAVLKNYTEQGYNIAIDDTGSGYSGLRTIYEVNPKYIKIDMDFIKNINKDSFKQSLVKSLVETSNSANIHVIAEGIETIEELKTTIQLGVEFGQGFFIQRPCENIKNITPKVTKIIKKEVNLINNIKSYSKDYHYINHIMEKIKTFDSKSNCIDIFNYIQKKSCTSISICDKGIPIGLATKHAINSAFAKQYGYSVYSNRPISLIMDYHPLIVDFYTPIYKVAHKALNRPTEKLYDDIIVCNGNKYSGIVTIKNLLEYSLNYEKN